MHKQPVPLASVEPFACPLLQAHKSAHPGIALAKVGAVALRYAYRWGVSPTLATGAAVRSSGLSLFYGPILSPDHAYVSDAPSSMVRGPQRRVVALACWATRQGCGLPCVWGWSVSIALYALTTVNTRYRGHHSPTWCRLRKGTDSSPMALRLVASPRRS